MNSRRLTHDRIHPSLVIKIPALNRDLMAMLHRKFDSQAKTALGQGLSSSPSSGHLNSVSAVPPIPDITATDGSTYALCQETLATSFDHLVGAGEERGGTARPSAFAVLRLITSLKVVAW
jgi:hypothetical protein